MDKAVIGNRLALAAAGVGLGLAARQVWRWSRAINLKRKVVLITGSSRGLGFVLAQEFARQGARLVLCARHEEELEAARQQIVALGAEVLAVPCDVAKREQAQWLIEQATDQFGHVDILVNNAGTIIAGPIQSLSMTDFEEAMAGIYWGTVYPTLTVLPQMLKRQSGHIVNITSVGGKVSVPHLLPYSSAKFAAVGFSEGLHAELAKEGIKVVTVAPGLMRTGSYLNAIFKGRQHEEFGWFSLGDNLPGTSVSARRAARQIVRATRLGKAEVILGWQAQAITRVHGLFPGITSEMLGVVNRLLPDAEGGSKERKLGKESQTPLTQSFLTTLGKHAAQEYQEHEQGALSR